jgi:hypothetical protein
MSIAGADRSRDTKIKVIGQIQNYNVQTYEQYDGVNELNQ